MGSVMSAIASTQGGGGRLEVPQHNWVWVSLSGEGWQQVPIAYYTILLEVLMSKNELISFWIWIFGNVHTYGFVAPAGGAKDRFPAAAGGLNFDETDGLVNFGSVNCGTTSGAKTK
jgi:hypothetical protein